MTTSPSAASGPYSLRDVRSLYPVVTETHLRCLDKWGLLRQSAAPIHQREYTFSDLLTVKRVAAELQSGTPLKKILRALVMERQGQLELDFHAAHAGPDTPRAKVVAMGARQPKASPAQLQLPETAPLHAAPPDPQAALAAKYFGEGSQLDNGDERNVPLAAAAYRKALIVDPDLVPALVNLANIHYAQDELIEAHALYERAIALDPDCFEAHFNLGNILHDLGRYEQATGCYRDAVAINPAYADAQFYLAVTLEKMGRSGEARPHWKAYQDLAPNGEWAELAREFLE